MQLLPQSTDDEFSVSNLLQKVAFVSVLHPKDLFVQSFVFPCTQIFSGNSKTEVIVVVVAKVVAEGVVVVAHYHAFCFDDEF